MAPDPDFIVIDDSEDEVDPAVHVQVACNGLTHTVPSSTPNSGPSCGQSPLVRHEGTSSRGQRSSREGPSRQLYQDDCIVDEAATEAHQQALSRTGKALADNNSVKAEDGSDPGQREPSEDDIAELEAELLRNSRLRAQLESGEGSSSNPQHLWRLRVYKAMLQQQEQLFSQAQQQDSMVIADSDGEEDGENDRDEEFELPPKKKQRTMPRPAPAVAAAAGSGGAGSSRQAQPRKRQQAQQQDQQQQEDGGGPLSENPAAAAAGSQGQQIRRPPRPPPHTQPRGGRNNSAAPAAAAAAGGGAAAAAGGGGATTVAADKVANRQLRAQLNRFAADMAARHDDLVDSKNTDLPGLLLKMQELGEKAARPREAAQHAGVLADAMEMGLGMIQNFTNERSGRNPSQLIAAVRRQFALDPAAAVRSDGPVAIDWATLGGVVGSAGLFRTAAGVSSMLDALAGQAKARKVVVRQRTAVEQEVRPVVGAAAMQDDGQQQQTDRVLTDMRRVMQRVEKCSALQLVLDHDSFSHTVENMFTLSFLCKDMFCSLEEDKELGLMVQHISPERLKELTAATQRAGTAAGASGSQTPHQFMMHLDMGIWRDMCAVVRRGDTLMPQRPRTTH